MMKKIIYFLLSAVLPVSVFAADGADKSLDLIVRRIGLDITTTQIENAAEYADSPVSALNSSSQDYIKGVFDTVLEFRQNKFNWDNSLFMEYGQTTLKPYDAEPTTDENADTILFSSDLTYACWDFSGLKFGPTVRTAYDTQFVDSADAPRQNIARSSAGISLFDHMILKSLYLTGVYEYDFTYSDARTEKTAAEIGWRLEYDLYEGVKIASNGYYREYFTFSNYVSTDLERDFSAVLRMDTKLFGDFSLGPYIQYRRAIARGTDLYGSSLILGLSFNYVSRFNLLGGDLMSGDTGEI